VRLSSHRTSAQNRPFSASHTSKFSDRTCHPPANTTLLVNITKFRVSYNVYTQKIHFLHFIVCVSSLYVSITEKRKISGINQAEMRRLIRRLCDVKSIPVHMSTLSNLRVSRMLFLGTLHALRHARHQSAYISTKAQQSPLFSQPLCRIKLVAVLPTFPHNLLLNYRQVKHAQSFGVLLVLHPEQTLT